MLSCYTRYRQLYRVLEISERLDIFTFTFAHYSLFSFSLTKITLRVAHRVVITYLLCIGLSQ